MASDRAVRIVLVMEAALTVALTAVVLDLRAHGDAERRTGVNAWGYQGSAQFSRPVGVCRIAIVGGSAAFGIGLDYAHSLASRLTIAIDRELERRGDGRGASVVSLAEA